MQKLVSLRANKVSTNKISYNFQSGVTQFVTGY